MASRIKGITIEINGETKGLDKALSSITSKSVEVANELKDVNKLLKLNPSNVELVAQKQQLLSKQIEVTTAKLTGLKNAQSQVEAQFKSGDIGEEKYRSFQRELTATENALTGYKRQLGNLKTEQTELGTNTQRLKTYFTATKTSVDDYASVLGTKLTNAIKNGTANSDQMKLALQKIAKEAGISADDLGKLDKALDDVGNSGKGISGVKSEIDRLGNSSSSASSDVRKLGDEGQSSSGKFERFKQAFSFGTVFSVAQSAFQTVTGGIGQLVSETVEASDALERFKGTMKFSGASDNEIKTVTKQVKQYADETVYDLDTVTSTTAQLASNGVKNYEGLTEASGNLNAVAGGNADTFKSVAMVMTQTAGAGKLTTENWNQLSDAIPGASGKIQEALKKNGAYTGNFRDAMAQGQITSDEFNKAIMQLGNKPVAVEAAKSTSTFSNAVGNAQADIESAMLKILDQFGGSGGLSKAVNEMSKVVVKGLNEIKKLIDFIQQHQTAFKIMAASVMGLVGAFKAMQLVNTVAKTLKDFNGITKIATGVQGAFNFVANANPILKWATIIAAVVTALVLFFTKTKTGKEIVANVTKFIKDAWQKLSDFLQPLFDAIGKVAKKIWDGITDVVGGVVKGIQGAWKGLSDFLSPLFSAIGKGIKQGFEIDMNILKATIEGIKGAWNGFKDFMSGLWDGIKGLAGPVWDGFVKGIKPVIESIKNLWNALKEYFQVLWDGIKNVASTVWDGIKFVVETDIKFISNVIHAVMDVLSQYWNQVWQTFGPFLTGVWNAIKVVIQTAIDVVKQIIQTAMEIIKAVWDAAWGVIKGVVSAVWQVISTVVSTTMNVIAGIIRAVVDVIKGDWKGAWNEIKGIFKTVWDGMKSIVKTVTDLIKSIIQNAWNAIKNVTTSVWNGIKSVTSSIWNGIKGVITNLVNGIKTTISNVWNNIKNNTQNVWNGIKSISSSIWNGIKSTISGIVNGIKTAISNVWNGIKSLTRSAWNAVKELMTNPVKAAKTTIGNIVEAIKGFFRNMHLRIPKIQLPPMPHFSINGNFSLNPPKVPSIGVRWYAKGAIFNKPALFNGPTGLSGAGEAGPEAMLPLNKSTLGMIGDKISKNMANANPINITVNVSGDGQDKTQLANEIAETIESKLRAVFNNESTAFGGGSIA